MRRVLAAVFAIIAAASATACHHGATPTAGAKTKPKLVVLVVIDQWPSWTFEKHRSLFTGGIARLLKEGAVVPEAELPYANPFTAPGHAVLATGATPNDNGIVGNTWWRRDQGRERPAEYDPSSPVLPIGEPLGGKALTDEDGASGKALRADGVADALREATGGAGHSVAIALKARSACLVAGRKPDLAIWYEPAAGGMTTSKAYAAEAPAWLVQFAKDVPVSHYFTSIWDARDPALLAKATGIADDSPGENSEHGLGKAFPHALEKSDHPESALSETPFADRLVSRTVAVALDAMQLGRDDTPDFLAISYSAHDYAGHNWGPDSWEELDLLLRLDGELGQLFDSLDGRLGANNWAVIVTSDHGATPLIERARLRSARRIPPKEVEQAADKAIAAELGGGPWIAKETSNTIYMTPKFAALSDADKNLALEAAVKGLVAVPGIQFAGRTDRFSPGCTTEKDIYQALCRAYVPGESGELYAVATAGSVLSEYKMGTGHDAPSDDNRRVPILVKAPGLAPQEGKGTLLQVAPTLAALLGVPPPAKATAPALFGIQRR